MDKKQIENILNSAIAQYANLLSKLSDGECLQLDNSIVICKWSGFEMFPTNVAKRYFNRQQPGNAVDFVKSEYLKGNLGYPAENFASKVISRYYEANTSFICNSSLYFTGDFYQVPVLSVHFKNVDDLTRSLVLSKLKPTQGLMDIKSIFNMISELNMSNYITYDSEKGIRIKTPAIGEKMNELLSKFGYSIDLPEETKDSLVDRLLKCDTYRIDVEPYNKGRLTDVSQGHWDIDGKKEVGNEVFFGRDPLANKGQDIKRGVVGIDFGTKSTVVYYQNEKNKSLPMPVGEDRNSVLDNTRFENPTIMEVISLSNFLDAYNMKEGRPETRWVDLKISQQAKRNYEDASDVEFNSFINNLKQWASGNNNNIGIVSKNDNSVYDLKPFLELEDGDFNPIECYAYLIGLYLNNMNLGIHLNYYISLPVKFEAAVKEKLRESFEKGLRKSLPMSVLNDSATMKKFKVNADISEPLAYAACALQEYKLDPSNGPINYAIFDFGGGTVDYDFGIWDNPDDEEQYSYKLTTFGGDGMGQMGGENLLADLATEVFKQNLQLLRDQQGDVVHAYKFQLGPTCDDFENADKFIDNSVRARTNTQIMVKFLRKFWENSANELNLSDDSEDEITCDEAFVDSFSGNMKNLNLKTKKSFISQFFETKIKEAINNFFEALNSHKSNFQGNEISIFLAGNSCKSPFVKRLFDEAIEGEREKDDRYSFIMYPPLGSDDAKQKMEDMGIVYSDNDYHPTGKTGVAYGLIECRKGGIIQIDRAASHRDKFAFFIGRNFKGKFTLFNSIPSGRPEIGQWYNILKKVGDKEEYEVYYSNLPAVTNGEHDLNGISKVILTFDQAENECASLYIRANGPRKIEYIVTEDEPSDSYEVECFTIDLI